MTRRAYQHSRGFTMVELIVVIVIIVIVAVVTALSFNAVSRSARLSGAITTVKGALGKGRALAMESNQWVLVVFRSVPDPSEPALVDSNNNDALSDEQEKRATRTEVVYGEYSGETGNWSEVWPPESVQGLPPEDLYLGTGSNEKDRYVEVPGAERYLLPRGVRVAGIDYFNSTAVNGGVSWATGPELKDVPIGDLGNINLVAHKWKTIGVMFAPDGTVRTRNNQTDGYYMWLDFNNNGWQEQSNNSTDTGNNLGDDGLLSLHAKDEPRILLTTVIGVYDSEEARELLVDPLDPASFEISELIGANGYINKNADPIFFNKFSGVIME